MPGLTLISELRGGGRESPSLPDAANVWPAQYATVFSRGYAAYPIASSTTEDYRLWFEGRIYGISEPHWPDKILAIAADLLTGQSHALARATRRINELDGDFVAIVSDRRSADIAIFTDRLARLPLYLHSDGSRLIVSRDFTVLAALMRSVAFDRLGLAEHLLYGYPLGPRTLLDQVERLQAGVAIVIREQPRQFRRVNLASASLGPDRVSDQHRPDNLAAELALAFRESLAARVAGSKKTILSLSGGLDSRAVAAALVAERHSFLAVTLSNGVGDPETRCAAKVASGLNLDWRVFPIPRATGSDLLRLLQLKGGLNYLGMGFIVPFFDSLVAEFGNDATFVTGDGGDKTLPLLEPCADIRTKSQLIDYIITREAVFPVKMVTAITGVDASELATALADRLGSCPSQEVGDLYNHFQIYERAFKWLFEGEDRNRHFFWSVTPFYGTAFLTRAMTCSRKLKSDYALYRLFMRQLNPSLVSIESTTLGPSMNPQDQLTRHLLRRAKAWVKNVTPAPLIDLGKRLKGPRPGRPIVNLISLQLSSPPVSDYLSPRGTKPLIKRLTPLQAYMLFTLTSTIEYLTTGKTALDRLYHEQL